MPERSASIYTRPIIKLETPGTEPSGGRSEDPTEIMAKLFVCSGRIYPQELWVHSLGLCSIQIDLKRILLEVGWNEVMKCYLYR